MYQIISYVQLFSLAQQELFNVQIFPVYFPYLPAFKRHVSLLSLFVGMVHVNPHLLNVLLVLLVPTNIQSNVPTINVLMMLLPASPLFNALPTLHLDVQTQNARPRNPIVHLQSLVPLNFLFNVLMEPVSKLHIIALHLFLATVVLKAKLIVLMEHVH